MKIYSVYDSEFKEFGRIVKGFDTSALLEVLGKRECPADGVVYNPSDAEIESLPEAKMIQEKLYGKMPVQIGYTNGHCTKMKALEYHRDSEFNVADQDIILLLARRQDLADDFTLDTEMVKAFKVPKGVMVEIYATSLHYAPWQTSDAGYRCIVVLPRGTNYPVEININGVDEERLMTATNKWLIAHPEGGCDERTFLGLKGVNLEI